MKPRVIILSAFLSPFRSGAEACVEEVALHLADRFAITIVTAKLTRNLPRKDSLQGKVAIQRVGLGLRIDKWLFPFLAPFTCRSIARYAPTGSPVIIHAILETFAGLALHFCMWMLPSAKRLLTLQTTNRSFLKKVVLRSPHAVTAISSVLKEQAEALGRSDVTVIPNGVDTASFPVQEKVPGRVLFVGRLERMKGVDTLLAAFAK